MGYRSMVALALTPQGVKALDKALQMEEKKELGFGIKLRAFFDEADKVITDKKSGATVYYWEDIKWYTDEPAYYPEVYFTQQLMENSLQDEQFKFIRIGENWDDIELVGGFDSAPITLSRDIFLG